MSRFGYIVAPEGGLTTIDPTEKELFDPWLLEQELIRGLDDPGRYLPPKSYPPPLPPPAGPPPGPPGPPDEDKDYSKLIFWGAVIAGILLFFPKKKKRKK